MLLPNLLRFRHTPTLPRAWGSANLTCYAGTRSRGPAGARKLAYPGHLRLILGEGDFTIKRGEAVEFSTWTPHWFGAVDGPVEAIMISGPHGEGLHLHS